MSNDSIILQPLSELKRRLWEKICPSQTDDSDIGRPPQPDFSEDDAVFVSTIYLRLYRLIAICRLNKDMMLPNCLSNQVLMC